MEVLREHSLTIFLVITGIGWILAFRAMDSESKWGQVVGNIVSRNRRRFFPSVWSS